MPLSFVTEAFNKYPAYDSFVGSVREEAVQNVRRLRHHPSVVIFGTLHVFTEFQNFTFRSQLAGNNEGTSPCFEKFFYCLAENRLSAC